MGRLVAPTFLGRGDGVFPLNSRLPKESQVDQLLETRNRLMIGVFVGLLARTASLYCCAATLERFERFRQPSDLRQAVRVVGKVFFQAEFLGDYARKLMSDSELG